MFAAQVVDFLENDQTALAIDRLFCQVSIDRALKVCTHEEVQAAGNCGNNEWIVDRSAEYESRRQELLLYLGEALVSKRTAEMIDNWNQANPYARPVNQDLIFRLERALAIADDSVTECYKLRNILHAADRFGWNHASQSEDLEYTAMLISTESTSKEQAKLRKELTLAKAGITGVN